MKLRHTETILQHTSTLDKSAVVVDTLFHSLILPAVVDNELFVAATAAMTHCWERAHASCHDINPYLCLDGASKDTTRDRLTRQTDRQDKDRQTDKTKTDKQTRQRQTDKTFTILVFIKVGDG